jgi:hypothetical protein
MNIPKLNDWQLWSQNDHRYVWRHTDYSLWMIVSYQPDHYNENGEQVMRVHGRAKYGTKMNQIGNITFGENIFVIIDNNTTKDQAFEKVFNWAQQWMEDYEKGKFDLDI